MVNDALFSWSLLTFRTLFAAESWSKIGAMRSYTIKLTTPPW
jgi:hypothetical protein